MNFDGIDVILKRREAAVQSLLQSLTRLTREQMTPTAQYLTDNGLGEAWTVYNTPLDPDYPDEYEETTIRDIVGRLVRYGSISDKQRNYLRTLLDRIDARATAVATPCPTGVATIGGTILAIKQHLGRHGHYHKMLVLSDRGFKVYGPCVAGAEKGLYITFTATVRTSGDPNFGLFNTPSSFILGTTGVGPE